MFRIPLPFTEDVLLLTPRWNELDRSVRVSLWLLLCLIPVVLVFWLYLNELRLVRRSTALVLSALRFILLFFILFIALLQPILARFLTEELPGRVLIAVDRSESMDVADPQRPPVDKLRLARALQLAGDICPDSRLDDWIRGYEHTGNLQWVADKEALNDPARRRQLASERQHQHDLVCRRIDSLTRTQMGRKVLSPDGLRLLEAITKKHKVDLLGFAREAWEVAADQLDELYGSVPGGDSDARPGEKTGKGNEAPAGSTLRRPVSASLFSGTDLRLPLIRALERSGPHDEKILGVVVFTDGRHNLGPSPVAKAMELGGQSLPIYPVALGDRRPPPDVVLTGIKAPPAVFKDVDTQVEARVKVSGLRPQDLFVELQRPERPPLRERIHHDGTDRYHTVRFQVRLDQVGSQSLTVAAQPVPGEIRTDNNSRPVVINVADDKAKVLLIDGEARWEYYYLASALARDRVMQLQSVVFAQPRIGKIPEDELKKIGNPVQALPAGPDALAGYDCIILGDVAPAQLPLPDRIRLEKYVADRGGTLVILAGKRFMPLTFAEAAAGPGPPAAGGEDDPLLKLLPLSEPRAVRPQKGFPITLTHEGQLAPFLQMDPAPDKSLSLWAALPLHFWGIVGKAKPGATSLAYLPGDQGLQEIKDQGAQEKEQALILRQNYGFGRVLFVGLESTWRWRYKAGDTYHHRFWGQVIRWAATDKPLVAGNDHVRFGTRDPVYPQGQEVELVVRLSEDVQPLAPGAPAGARILRLEGDKEEAVALVPLTRHPAQPRVLEGRLRDLPAGQYSIELAIPDLADRLRSPAQGGSQPARLRATFTVTPSDSAEMNELATNFPLLEELAARSGGKVFTPENATELEDLLTRQAVTRLVHTENRLWQWWPTLAIFLLLLTAEWVARKWAGLP